MAASLLDVVVDAGRTIGTTTHAIAETMQRLLTTEVRSRQDSRLRHNPHDAPSEFSGFALGARSGQKPCLTDHNEGHPLLGEIPQHPCGREIYM